MTVGLGGEDVTVGQQHWDSPWQDYCLLLWLRSAACLRARPFMLYASVRGGAAIACRVALSA